MDKLTQRFLVTGSSGFVGSRLVRQLLSEDNQIWGLDILSSPFSDDKKYNDYHHFTIDLTSQEAEKEITKLLDENKIQMVIHLASLIKVGEGEKQPDRYKKVNIEGTEIILKAMKAVGLKKIIFASSAAVYKSPVIVPINEKNRLISSDMMSEHSLKETDTLDPVSVYGKTKLIAEKLIRQYVKSDKFEGIAFRFFNVSGGKEIHNPSVHLIPIIIDKLIRGEPVQIFGKDYPTSDGTCYRDYFHVKDLIRAILKVIEKWDRIHHPNENIRHFLSFGNTVADNSDDSPNSEIPGWKIYNLGQGVGYTVLQVFKQVNKQCSAQYKFQKSNNCGSMVFVPRRPGDPPILLANCRKAEREFGWKTDYQLGQIISDTLEEMLDSKKNQIKD
uniref:NAD dependent epimerase/dehydratase n=1 Tax=Pithovirus LCPAC201 TaxID=2506591 RepID=A0A481Z7B6_9VIRU|nr:MAG: NAD dependent epimerase/dehydratase [Pithovirus LCPAC201]